jgi:tetratricopeptide (TPR) repeat protein
VHAIATAGRRAAAIAVALLACGFPLGAHVTAVSAQQAAPDDPYLAVPDHADVNGCVNAPAVASEPPMLPPDDPEVLRSFKGLPASLAAYRSRYADERHDLLDAVFLRRRELAASTDDEGQKDWAIRLPLSVDLARLGRWSEARAIWRDLMRRQTATLDDPAFAQMKAGRFDLALQRVSANVASINPAYEDSGAGAHVVRGIDFANRRDADRAAAEWRLALRCSPDFEQPHFLLAAAEQLRHHTDAARSEWLATLESWDPQPPGPRWIDPLKFEAMLLLMATRSAPANHSP